jgi:hypothetical protein
MPVTLRVFGRKRRRDGSVKGVKVSVWFGKKGPPALNRALVKGISVMTQSATRAYKLLVPREKSLIDTRCPAETSGANLGSFPNLGPRENQYPLVA